MARSAAARRISARSSMPFSLAGSGAAGQATFGDVFDKERTDAFSVSYWALPRSASLTGGSLRKNLQSGNFRGWLTQVSALKPEFALISAVAGSNYLHMQTTLPIRNGVWNHIVYTYDGTSAPGGVKIYVNGVSVALTTLVNGLSATTLGGGAALTLGQTAAGTNIFVGLMTHVRIHNVALSQAQVDDLYYEGIAASVQAEWLMTDGSGTTLTASVGGVNGTITTPSWVAEAPVKARAAASARAAAAARSAA